MTDYIDVLFSYCDRSAKIHQISFQIDIVEGGEAVLDDPFALQFMIRQHLGKKLFKLGHHISLALCSDKYELPPWFEACQGKILLCTDLDCEFGPGETPACWFSNKCSLSNK